MEEGLSIILPAYNEQDNIIQVAQEIISYVPAVVRNSEVIVVDDGSRDSTLTLLYQFKRMHPELQVVSHRNNRGYGSAIKTGIGLAGKDWILIMDSDGQYNINELAHFWKNRKGCDFILGYRQTRNDNIYRRLCGRVGNQMANLFFKERIKDHNCGFKLFKASRLKSLSLISTGGCMYFEILLYLVNPANKFMQLPVRHYRRQAGRATGASLRVIIKNLWEGARIVLGG